MRIIGASVLLVLSIFSTFAQQEDTKNTNIRIGKFYAYWGWNLSGYSTSDITFEGDNYNFTLRDVAAQDRQSPFGLDYFNPVKVSIPQYNFRFGYYLRENLDISFGQDHMKYVIIRDQIAKISGNISGTGTIYDGSYANEDLQIAEEFLKFEHTDGLNYVNIEIRKSQEVLKGRKVDARFIHGFGIGALVPRTNATLFNNERYDEFHLSGYGLAGIVGFNVIVYKRIFAQAELKGGYINMPDIRTTISPSDRASQKFLFYQYNIVFGWTFDFKKDK